MINPLNIFKKKTKHLGYWTMVRWKNEAVDHALGYDFMKEIWHFNGTSAFERETYNDIKIKELKKEKVFIYDSTRGEFIPKDSKFVTAAREILGVLQMSKRV